MKEQISSCSADEKQLAQLLEKLKQCEQQIESVNKEYQTVTQYIQNAEKTLGTAQAQSIEQASDEAYKRQLAEYEQKIESLQS